MCTSKRWIGDLERSPPTFDGPRISLSKTEESLPRAACRPARWQSGTQRQDWRSAYQCRWPLAQLLDDPPQCGRNRATSLQASVGADHFDKLNRALLDLSGQVNYSSCVGRPREEQAKALEASEIHDWCY